MVGITKRALLPGEAVLEQSSVGNLITCKKHGYQYTRAYVHCGSKVKPVCGDCFDAGVGTLPEPDIADPMCNVAACTEAVHENQCRKCRKRKCTKHMYMPGPSGLCRDCEGISNEAVLDEAPMCDIEMCFSPVLFQCKQCGSGFCGKHMDGDNTSVCTNCLNLQKEMTGLDDDN